MNSRSIVLTCIKSLLIFNHCICIFFFKFVSCLLTVTLHLVDVRFTCLINITYLLTYLYVITHICKQETQPSLTNKRDTFVRYTLVWLTLKHASNHSLYITIPPSIVLGYII